ncbi:hypothetical protein AVEN_40879-1 [Araneus ventricosus]|uniref:Uncharacterized protein n=1 Tax=Araneus ventricosus TaxID=182803 RepID=A0A4Y2SA73_ARAVE|nr:hypothetical protein AVEN_40879-1 [Araneus ventricosus]
MSRESKWSGGISNLPLHTALIAIAVSIEPSHTERGCPGRSKNLPLTARKAGLRRLVSSEGRDPNKVVEENEGKSSNERGRGRFEKINWPVYDSIHQKYIALGEKILCCVSSILKKYFIGYMAKTCIYTVACKT